MQEINKEKENDKDTEQVKDKKIEQVSVLSAPETKELFRDSLATINKEGKRVWLYPKKPHGIFYKYRTYLSWVLLLFLFGAPFIKVGGHPLLLFNVLERNFVIFGIPFGPHDFHLFFLAMITLILFVVLFTVVFGRIFCGWFCPQTIFMEMVFRKIEYWIEGDSFKQKKLKQAPMSASKFFKKTSKHIIFFALAFIIANTFLAYIIGIDELLGIITDPPSAHLAGLMAILIFSGAFYGVYSYFREQVCTVVCPYGRLQGVLLDPNSIVVAYDYSRGEPRGNIKRNEERTIGDCIDCHQCVDVCPTGIDIRNGTQLECVNCTACIDACDAVMEKVHLPKGLIRYDSEKNIKEKSKKIFTPRVIGYSIVLFVLAGLLTFLLLTRTDVEVSVLRTPGMFFQEQPENKLSNLYDIRVVNKTYQDREVTLELIGKNGELKILGNELNAPPQGSSESRLMVIISKDELDTRNNPITIGVYENGELIDEVNTNFMGPGRKKKE